MHNEARFVLLVHIKSVNEKMTTTNAINARKFIIGNLLQKLLFSKKPGLERQRQVLQYPGLHYAFLLYSCQFILGKADYLCPLSTAMHAFSTRQRRQAILLSRPYQHQVEVAAYQADVLPALPLQTRYEREIPLQTYFDLPHISIEHQNHSALLMKVNI